MPKKAKTLNDAEVRKQAKRIAAEGVQRDFAVGGVSGGSLCLRVDGTKTPPTAAWYLRSRGEGGGKIGLGVFPVVTLKEARANAEKRLMAAKAVGLGIGAANKAAKEAKRQAAEEKKRRAKMLSMAALFSQWQTEEGGANPRYATTKAVDASLFRLHIAPVALSNGEAFGDKAADAVTARDLFEVCLAASKPTDGVHSRRREGGAISQSAQSRIRTILRALLDCAIRHGLIPAVNLMLGAEFRTLARTIERDKAAETHDGALAPAEMPAFVRALCEHIADCDAKGRSPTAARALLFAILTNARQKNALNLRRSEIANGVWTIAAKDMKVEANGNHRVYLAPEAVELIEAAPVLAETDCVFASPRTGAPMLASAARKVIAVMSEAREAAGEKPWIDAAQSTATGAYVAVTPHGLARATFATWAEEATDKETGSAFSRKAAELNLHHKDKADSNNGAYLRATLEDERRRLSNQWARFCLSETPAALWAKVTRKAAQGAEASKPAAPKAPKGRGGRAPAISPDMTDAERKKAEERYYFGMYGLGR